MTTKFCTVVNLRKAEYDVYIGRAGHGEDGDFGNPIRPLKPCPECNGLHDSPGSTLRCYKRYFDRRLDQDPEFRAKVLALAGKRLGCFCDGACHGYVLSAWVNAQKSG